MFIKMAFAYVVIEKATNRCVNVIHTNTENWNIDDDYAFSVQVEIDTDDYLDKYYYSAEDSTEKTWWTRIWNEYNEDGTPNKSACYTDTPWTPGE